MDTPDPSPSSQIYVQAVELLVQGRAEESAALLEPLVRDSSLPEALLALGKCYLELRRGEPARACFRRILDGPPAPDPALAAYVRLLDAFAVTLAGDSPAAERLLDEVARVEPRLEPAARSLRRQLTSGRPAVLRL
jgi:tetratricopeptide (TPR) repeat protein